jgi:PAS domain S-box-containing protein
VIEHMPLPVALYEGPEHRIVAASAAFRRMLGDRELIGRPAAEALPELVHQGFLVELDRAYRTGERVVVEAARADFDSDRDGVTESHFVDYSYQPLFDDGGAVWAVLAGVVSVTERVKAQVAAQANEHRMQQVLDALPVGVLLADAQGRLIWQNPASRRIWGGQLDEFGEYRGWWAESGEPVLPHQWGLPRALAGEESQGEVLDVQGFGGLRRTLLNSAATIRDETGAILGAVAVYEDITEAREGERRRVQLAAALEGLQEGVWLLTPDGEVVYANQAISRILGVEGTAAGRRLTELHAETGAELEEALRSAGEQGRWSGRVRSHGKHDGRELTLEVLLGRVDHAFGGEDLLFGILRDVSGQIQVERQLRQAERLASLGTLVGGVAHELNNPLSAVLGFVELMLMDERPPAEREDLETIRREAERMAKIVADLRVIARGVPEQANAEHVDMNDVVRHVLKTRSHSLARNRVEVREDLAVDLPRVQADRGRLEQAVLNLVVNAEQAMLGMEGDRRLILRTRQTAQGASLQVVDNGPGIPPRHLERIFDPFFTTKGPGEGTGLGLALVHTIVSEHRGEIRVDSEVGAGTAFRVDLPRAMGTAEQEAAPVAAQAQPERTRVLVVDDETPVRRVVVRYLARLGYDADEAADGKQALSMIDWADQPYSAIISDLRMPGLSGDELFRRLAERGLARRLIFLTGDTASQAAADLLEGIDVPILAKPVSMDELGRALREAIG